MNKTRRKIVNDSIEKIKDIKDDLSIVMDEEEYALQGLEEHFSNTERYEKMEAAVELLCDAIDDLDEAVDKLENIE